MLENVYGRARRAQRPGLSYLILTGKCGQWDGIISKMIKAHNMAPKELSYGFPCVVLRTAPLLLDTIERGLIIGHTIFNVTIDDIFLSNVTSIWLG